MPTRRHSSPMHSLRAFTPFLSTLALVFLGILLLASPAKAYEVWLSEQSDTGAKSGVRSYGRSRGS